MNKLQGWNFASEFYTLWIQEHTTKNCVKKIILSSKGCPLFTPSPLHDELGHESLTIGTSYYYQILLLHNSHGKSIWLTWFYDIMHQILQYQFWFFKFKISLTNVSRHLTSHWVFLFFPNFNLIIVVSTNCGASLSGWANCDDMCEKSNMLITPEEEIINL
jgi:hypothetical protein